MSERERWFGLSQERNIPFRNFCMRIPREGEREMDDARERGTDSMLD